MEKEIALEKLKLLIGDLTINHEKEQKEGKNYFNNDLFAIRVIEIYNILKGDSNEKI